MIHRVTRRRSSVHARIHVVVVVIVIVFVANVALRPCLRNELDFGV